MAQDKEVTGLGRNYPTMVLVVLASIAIMVMYVEAMAFPSLEKVMASFNLSYPGDVPLAYWIITIYLVVGAVAIPVFGKLGDIYGKKKMLTIAMLIYSIAVTCTGFSRDISSSFYVMLGFRAVQGIGMCMFPLAFSIIRDEFPVERIAVAQGVVSAMFGVGTAVGFVLGGFVIDQWGWQWTYHTVVPFVLIATAVVAFKIRESPVRMKSKVDYVGAALLGLALISFLIAVTEGDNRGWTSPIILFLFAVSAAAFVLFSFQEIRTKYPLIRPSLLRDRDIALVNVVAFMIGFGMFGGQSVIAIIAQFKFGLSPLETGILLLPASAVSFILGPTVGILVKRHGPKWPVVAGMVIPIVGFIYLYYHHATKTDITMGIAVMSGGLSFAMVGSINMLIISTPQIETAISSAMNMIIRTVGGVVGPAVAAVIIAAHEVKVVDPISGLTVSVASDVAYQIIFLMSAFVMVLGAALAFLLTDKRALGEGKGFAVRGRAEPIPAACQSPTIALADCEDPPEEKTDTINKRFKKH
jgi:EmrB/QacA subfamily drug resistance transporter